jgi:hypothetical protein
VSDPCQITTTHGDQSQPNGRRQEGLDARRGDRRHALTTAEQNCHAGGRGFESVAPVKRPANRPSFVRDLGVDDRRLPRSRIHPARKWRCEAGPRAWTGGIPGEDPARIPRLAFGGRIADDARAVD